MNLTIPFSNEWFQAEHDSRVSPTPSGGFRLNTTPEGGGMELLPGSLDSSVWQEYEFMNAEVYHDSHDVLVLLFSFRDQDSRMITYHTGILPGVRTVICLPLKHLNGEKLFLDRYPGVMQTVLRGDARVDRKRIAGFSIATIPSTTSRSVEISGLSLSGAEPDFTYDYHPYIDGLGQLKGRDWQGKTANQAELSERLHLERQLAAAADFSASGLGRYGGWKGLAFQATGYFRTEFDGSNWWFADPDGYALFSTGMDCAGPASPMHVTGMEHLIPQLPGREGSYHEAWSQAGQEFSFGIANLITTFGSEWRSAWTELTEYRLRQWGFNTIGNWSDDGFIKGSELPYVYPLSDFPATEQTIFRDFPDVFSREYEQNAEEFAKQLVPLRGDRRMIGYFMRNEPHWAFVDSLNLTQLMLKSPVRYVSKERFIQWLGEKYGTVEQLNEAWASSYASFEQLYTPHDTAASDHPGREADYAQFNRMMIRRYVEIPARLCKQADPNHLNLGMRYAWVGSDDVLEGCEWFDVFSLNCYQFAPDREQIMYISERLGKPVMIGEYHFGAADGGMLAYGIRAVATREERGSAYRYYVEQAAAIPQLIGVHYFQWNDQPVLGRFDGENYGIGVVDVCNRPYEHFVQAAKQAHEQMYPVRTGLVEPYNVLPAEIPKTGF
ncbi:beta-galactosidase [Paenibacillus sp. FSL L8-0470]|uniref:beta-galactosidase n=1 Tax=Paenibacillus sp. FSL L8-0470 TaxID=2954688 RepID=UPI0030F58CD9